MFKSLHSVLMPLALLLAVPAAWSGTPINEHRLLNANARLSVNNIAGNIDVQAWDKNEMSLTGELGDGVEKLEISGDASALSVVVKMPKHSRNTEDSLLQLRVPAGVSVDVQGVSADIRVQGLRGAVSVNSVSGEVNLDVGSARVDAQTVSGDLHLRAPSGATKVGTVSGDLSVEDIRGDLNAESVSGDIKVSGGPFSGLKLNSVSGDVQIDGSLSDKAAVTVESLSGNIRLILPANASASLVMKTFSGDLASDFGGVSGDSKRVETQIGDGKGKITLSSFSGDVGLRRSRH
jgi:DUF4097 and DUF4098 domain-containing protein YvlB